MARPPGLPLQKTFFTDRFTKMLISGSRVDTQSSPVKIAIGQLRQMGQLARRLF